MEYAVSRMKITHVRDCAICVLIHETRTRMWQRKGSCNAGTTEFGLTKC